MIVPFDREVFADNRPSGELIWQAPESFAKSLQLEALGVTSANASLGDIDSDGDLDIVLAKGRHWPLVDYVLINDGNGSFSTRYEVSPDADRTYTAALADIDGDGNFLECKQLSVESATTIAAGDFNNDGFADLIVPHRDRGQSYIFINDGKDGFTDSRRS